jgi:hypothetical protein
MPCRRFIAVITAVLFSLSTAGHGFVSAGMANGPGMDMAATADMAFHDASMDCGERADCAAKGMQMACFIHCATVLGILSAPNLVPVPVISRELNVPVVHPLAGLHGPPEPHPPKSLILT